jgi:hypothetical protein
MISCKTNEIELEQPVNAFIRFWAIADHITQAPDLLEVPGILDHSVERSEVGMEV